MAYFYGSIGDIRTLFEMDEDGYVHPCDDGIEDRVGFLRERGEHVRVLRGVVRSSRLCFDCAGHAHRLVHKADGKQFFRDETDGRVWCIASDEIRVFHPSLGECPLTGYLALAEREGVSFPLWDKDKGEYVRVEKAGFGWYLFAKGPVREFKMRTPNVTCRRFALREPVVDGD